MEGLLRPSTWSLAAGVALLGWFHGGYSPALWGWSALIVLWVVTLTLLGRAHVLVDAAGLVFLVLVVGLTGWTALSAAWSLSEPRTMLEVERDLVYVACVALVVLVTRTVGARALLLSLVAGFVAVVAYGLGSYLASPVTYDATQGYLLFRPLGYANALGGIAVLALMPVLALGAYDARRAVRAAAGSATVVLAVSLYLTQNRAAWLAVVTALVVWILRTRESETALAHAVLAGAAVAAVAALGLLDGRAHRLAAGAIVLVATGLAGFMPPFRLSRRLAVRGAWGAAALVIAASVASLFRLGDRAHYWGVAWRAFLQHPIWGSGAGTFDVQWFRYRDLDRTVRDAHNLYLGTLADLGVVGLVLLAAALVFPVLAARRTRDPLLTAGLASYCGFLVHVAFEWDWKFPAVAGSGLVLGAVLVVAEPVRPAVRLGGAGRIAATAVTVLAASFALAALVGNSYLVASERRVSAGDAGSAAEQAKHARAFLPWASEPWLVLADSRTESGDLAGGRTALRQAVARDRNDWTLWVRLAAVARGDERVLALRRALVLNPMLGSRPG